MHLTIKNILEINEKVKQKIKELNYSNYMPKIIADSKTFPLRYILPLIEHGHQHFGENKVQEALSKWSEIKSKNKNLKVHLVGSLQSNKVKYAVGLFDYIHSVDSIKLANKIVEEQIKQGKKLKIFASKYW